MRHNRAAPRRGTYIFGIVGDILGMGAKMSHAEEMQDDAQHFADTQAAVARDFNASEAQKLRDWQTHMSNTQFQRAAKDLEAANINPILAYAKGGAGIPGGAAASSSAPSGGIAGVGEGPRISASMQSASQIAVNDAIEERTRAEAEKVRAEKNEIEARTPTHAVSMDRMRQEISESIERMRRIEQETKHHASSAKHLDQQVINLQAELPRIEATIRQLNAQVRLTGQQTKTSAAEEHRHYIESGRAGAQDEETRQRIRANLPALEAAYKELQNQLTKLKTPQAGMQAATHSSFLGAWNAVVRALLGMESK